MTVTEQSLASEVRRRRRELAADLQGAGADALIATREGTVTYLTGYTTRTWSNFSRPVVAVLFADETVAVMGAETEGDSVRQIAPDADVRTYVALLPVEDRAGLPDGRVQFGPEAGQVLERLLADHSVSVIAVDGLNAAFPPVAQVQNLMPGFKGRTIDASGMVWKHRLRKSPWEIDRMRESVDMLDRAFEIFETRLRPGLSERKIHGLLAAASFEAGADLLGYTNAVAGTDRELFGAPRDRVWQKGEMLYVDGGVVLDGYWSDFCRMYSVGKPSPEQSEGYGRSYRGLQRVLDGFERCSTAGDLSRLIAEATDIDPGNVGFGRFGHGIGLYMPEPPSLHVGDDTPLEDGMVICIEPAVVHDGANYVVEEEHVVQEGKPVRISPPARPSIIEV